MSPQIPKSKPGCLNCRHHMYRAQSSYSEVGQAVLAQGFAASGLASGELAVGLYRDYKKHLCGHPEHQVKGSFDELNGVQTYYAPECSGQNKNGKCLTHSPWTATEREDWRRQHNAEIKKTVAFVAAVLVVVGTIITWSVI